MAKSKTKKKVRKTNRSGDNFLLLHGEKFVFAAILCCAVMMIAKGNGLEKFTITPEDITESAVKAEDQIKKSKVEITDIDDSIVVYDYSTYSRLIKSTLSPGMYHTGVRWEQSLFPEKIKRPDVVPLPLEQLRAESGIGAVQYQSEQSSSPAGAGMGGMSGANKGSAENVKARSWIVVTGLIPVGKEFQEYDEKFSGAQFTDVNRDVPRYVSYEIERGTKGEDGEIAWEPIDLEKVYNDEIDLWGGIGIDPVSTIHSVPVIDIDLPSLTMPCPPLLNKAFGEEVAHLPKIPLLSDENLEEQSRLLQETKELEKKQQDTPKRSFNLSGRSSFFDSAAGGLNGQAGTGAGPKGKVNGLQAGNQGMAPNGMVNSGATIRQNLSQMSKNLEDDYYLFRFFDFDVKPDQTYYYRVKLYLANPNLGLDVNLVENPETVSKNVIESAFSEPSNPASLGTAARILAESVEPAKNLWQEPKVSITSIFFSSEDAQESLAREKKLVRGQVANFMREQHKPVNRSGAGIAPMASAGPKGKNTRLTDDHISNICLIDSMGGNSVKVGNSEAQSPAELLFLDSAGNIRFRNLDTDLRELNRYVGTSGK